MHKHKGNKKSIVKILNNFRWTYKIAICLKITKFSSVTCFTALIKFSNGSFSYILASNLLKTGGYIYSTNKPSKFFNLYYNNCNTILKYLNYKSIFFNLERFFNYKAQYSKSAGTFCKIINFDYEKNLVKLQLPTNNLIFVNIYCFITLGRASNINNKLQFFTKAGFNFKKGFKPKVRGVAMNPVDHPHGGRTKTNKPELTPWGKIAKKNK